MNHEINTYDLYRDIKERTGGEIYIGVLGPVRTGKSTFIKRFMETMVLPYMEDEHSRTRARDEMPQSASGRTITTTEPKFIPKEAAEITLDDDVKVRVRLIDCVGYMVDGAAGHMEENEERMVKTPWFDYEIPFTKAAEVGTDKVMNDHSTVGLVITTDGSFGELERKDYLAAEEKTIMALKGIRKPFLVLLNSQKPFSEEAKKTARSIAEKYSVNVVPVNCEQLKKEDIHRILENLLYEFPVSAIEFYMPKWVEMLAEDHRIRQEIIREVLELMPKYGTVREILADPVSLDNMYISGTKTEKVNPADGTVRVTLDVGDSYYYEMLSEMTGETVCDEYQLISRLKEYAAMKKEYSKVLDAMKNVRSGGYGVVTPAKEEITLNRPELIRQGNKFGVKIKAISPSIHMIRANIETEIAPIVGSQEQADDLIRYIGQEEVKENGIWETNIFGKTVEQLVEEGIRSKVTSIGEESQIKLQDTMQKIVNDINGGMVCIII